MIKTKRESPFKTLQFLTAGVIARALRFSRTSKNLRHCLFSKKEDK